MSPVSTLLATMHYEHLLHVCLFRSIEAHQSSSNLEVSLLLLLRYTDVTMRLVVRDPLARFRKHQTLRIITVICSILP